MNMSYFLKCYIQKIIKQNILYVKNVQVEKSAKSIGRRLKGKNNDIKW